MLLSTGRTLNPLIVYALEIWFFFLMGQEIAFSSWIASYVVDAGISSSDAKAAYATSAFYAAMLLGRLAMGLTKNIENIFLLDSFVVFQLVSSGLLLGFMFFKDSMGAYAYSVLVALIVVRPPAYGLSVYVGLSTSVLSVCVRAGVWSVRELSDWNGHQQDRGPPLSAMVRSPASRHLFIPRPLLSRTFVLLHL